MRLTDVVEGPVTEAVHLRVTRNAPAVNAARMHWLAEYFAGVTVEYVIDGVIVGAATAAECAIYADRLARFAELGLVPLDEAA